MMISLNIKNVLPGGCRLDLLYFDVAANGHEILVSGSDRVLKQFPLLDF